MVYTSQDNLVEKFLALPQVKHIKRPFMLFPIKYKPSMHTMERYFKYTFLDAYDRFQHSGKKSGLLCLRYLMTALTNRDRTVVSQVCILALPPVTLFKRASLQAA